MNPKHTQKSIEFLPDDSIDKLLERIGDSIEGVVFGSQGGVRHGATIVEVFVVAIGIAKAELGRVIEQAEETAG